MIVCVDLDYGILIFYENGSNNHQMSPDICNLGTVTYGDFVLFIYDKIHQYVTSIRNHYFWGQMEKRGRERDFTKRERERIFQWEREERETEIFSRHYSVARNYLVNIK